jgi:hypothetical protein
MLADFAEPTNDFVDTLRIALDSMPKLPVCCRLRRRQCDGDQGSLGIWNRTCRDFADECGREELLTEGRLENSREYEKNESTEAAPDTYRHFEQLALLPV